MIFSKGSKAQAESFAHDPLVAVDIGSSKIRLLAGEVNDSGEINVIYFKEIPSAGMVNGAVSDLNELSDKLSELVHDYESATEFTFSHCIIGISGRHIMSENELGNATVPTHRVTEQDRQHAIAHASSIKFSDLNHIIHVLPQTYEIDDAKDITNPIGLSAMRLGVVVHLIACNEDQENNLRSAIERLSPNISVDQVIYSGIAAADAVLSQNDKDLGVCLIDYGEGTVDVSVYENSNLVLTFGLEYGGRRMTRDIATRFGVPLRTSEIIKIKHGVAHPGLLDEREANTILSIPVRHTEEKVLIGRIELANTVGLLLSDTFNQIRNRLELYTRSTGQQLALGAGFVLTGGVAKTVGICRLGSIKLSPQEGSFKVLVRVGEPRGVITDFDEMLSPDCATVVGLLRFGYAALQDSDKTRRMEEERKRNSNSIVKAVSSFKAWLSREF